MNLDDRYRLADGVAIRPERFGGLVYDYHTRRLYFIHSHHVAALVGELTGDEPLGDALAAFRHRRGLTDADAERLIGSLASLQKIGVVVRAADTAHPSPALGAEH